MTAKVLLITVFFSLLPISELRGAIPFAVSQSVPVWLAYLVAVGFNALVAPLAYLFLSTFHRLFLRMGWYARFFHRFIDKARLKVQDKVDRFGYLGILIFVAIPLPVTGAWTGTLGAWILGMDRKKTVLAVLGGVMISGLIVSLVVVLGVQAFSVFIKQV